MFYAVESFDQAGKHVLCKSIDDSYYYAACDPCGDHMYFDEREVEALVDLLKRFHHSQNLINWQQFRGRVPSSRVAVPHGVLRKLSPTVYECPLQYVTRGIKLPKALTLDDVEFTPERTSDAVSVFKSVDGRRIIVIKELSWEPGSRE